MRVGEHDEEDDADDASEREGSGGRDVAVPGCKRTRGERSDQLCEGRRNEPGQRVGGDERRLMRKPPGDQLSPESGEGGREDGGRNGDRDEGDRVSPELAPQLPGGFGPGEIRHDDHAEGLGAEHQDQIHAIGRHEPVRLDVATELVSEECAGNRRGEAQRHI